VTTVGDERRAQRDAQRVIWCVGAGAVGGCVASRLARAGADVFVADANAEHVRIITSDGLRVDGLDAGERTVLRAGPSESPPDVVLLAVRSSATQAALDQIAPHLTATTDVVSLQNGLNEDGIAAAVGPDRTIGCVVGFGATWIEPGRISLDADGGLTVGRLDGSSDARLETVRDLLNGAFTTSITDNVRGALWAKMLVNSMTVLGALGGMLTGDVLGTPERRRLVADVVAEGVRVARSEGVELPDVFGLVPPEQVDGDGWHTSMERALVRVGKIFGAIRSVTWRDFELGRKTEIDAVTGEIVSRGERGGVPTPLSSRVYAMLREIEAGERSPAASNLEALVAAPR
jgi:2-dehydropantoate 2-reductase